MKEGNFILKYRWAIIIFSVLLTVVVGYQALKLKIDPNIEAMIPEDMQSRLDTKVIQDIFGNSEMIVIVFETDDILKDSTLERIEKISKKLNRSKNYEQILSLFDVKNIHSEEGMMVIDPAVLEIPETDEEREILKNQITENTLAYKVVVSDDFKYTAIFATVKDTVTDENAIAEIENILAENPGNEEVHFGGQPYLRENISSNVREELIYLLPIAIGLMLFLFWFSFREFKGMILPLTVVVMSILFSVGLMSLIGWQFTIISLLLPIFLIAVTCDYSIHYITRYQEIGAENPDFTKNETIKTAFSRIRVPVFLTGITTIAGLLSLGTHLIIPAKQLGLLGAIAICFALFLSLIFVPAIYSFGKPTLHAKQKEVKNAQLEKILRSIATFIVTKPKKVISIVVPLSLLIGIGIFFLEIDGNVVNFFKKDSDIRISNSIIDEKFGGSQTISVLVEGDIKDPIILKQIETYETEFNNMKGVGNVVSLATIIKEMSKGLYVKGEDMYNRIPDTKEAVSQYIELYSMGADPQDFEKLVNFDYTKARILIRVNDGNSSTILKILDDIKALTSNDKNVTIIAGDGVVEADIVHNLIRGQIYSLLTALILVIIIMIVYFRSFKAGLISAVPLVFAMLLLFGIMGFADIKLDAATTLLTSLMIGIGIDLTIHFLCRTKAEIANGFDFPNAIIIAISKTGKGIMYNALTLLLGFAVLTFSQFLPLKFFSLMIFISISACLIGALVLVPSIVAIVKPKFLMPKENNKIKLQEKMVLEPVIAEEIKSEKNQLKYNN